MSIIDSLLLWLHLLGLLLSGGALLAGAVLAQVLSTAGEQRTSYLELARKTTRVGHTGLGLLIVTGPLLLWLKWGGAVPSQAWFGVKMLFVLIVIIGVIVNSVAFRRWRNGDADAAKLVRQSRLMTAGSLVVVILAAAFTFG